jgi:hypothetical protein
MSKSLSRRVAGVGAAFALGLGALAGAPLASAQSVGGCGCQQVCDPCGCGTGSLGSLNLAGLGMASSDLMMGSAQASTDMALASSQAMRTASSGGCDQSGGGSRVTPAY